MAEIYSQSWTNPTSTATIYMDTYRDGADIIVNATVVCTLTYSSGYIVYDGEINFNMWSGSVSASANIKGYSDRWSANTARTRTRTCSMRVRNLSNSLDIGFNMTIPDSRPAGAAFRIGNQSQSLPTSWYTAPTAPTWSNISPNPCNIKQAPLILWGGASAGSLGVLKYDVEVRSTKPTTPVTWTNWLRIATAQADTSYQEINLNLMNVFGQTPFVGVQYQYRIRSTDNTYSQSSWRETPVLTVSFVSPTPPTNYTLTSTTVKKDGVLGISWSGATGGDGSISSYKVSSRYFNHNTNLWTNWEQQYQGNNDNYSFNIADVYPNARNGDSIQLRISTINSWGQESSYLVTALIKIRGNQIWIKINGDWKEGDLFIKISGDWVEATPYIKVGGDWKEST